MTQLQEYEQLLNRHTSQRYHLKESDEKYSLVEIIRLKERLIVEDLTDLQMLEWLKAHVRVELIKDSAIIKGNAGNE